MRTVMAALTCSLLVGCPREEHAHRPVEPAFATHEPVQVQRGMRAIEVHCALECGNAQVELSRLQRDCVRDPRSTVHHVTERAPMIALGCCTEAAGAFTEACGDESTLGACIRRWSSHCEQGQLLMGGEPHLRQVEHEAPGAGEGT